MSKDGHKIELEFSEGQLSGIRIGGELFNGSHGGVLVPKGVEWSQAVTATEDGGISWKIRLREHAGEGLRSGFLKVRIPYPHSTNGLMVWSAGIRFPEPLCNLGGTMLHYGGVTNGTVIPIVSLYDPNRNLGMTVAKPLARRGGRFGFRFGANPEDGLEVVFSDFALKPHDELEFELLLCGHVGCWRPGLRWFADRYPEFFLPPNPEVWRHHGAFAITSPFTTPETVTRLEGHSVRWSELHNHFPHYGCYAPESEEWDSVVLHDYPELRGEIPSRISPGLIREHIRRLHRSHILAMMYIQCTGDGLIPWAESTFPESIARDASGKPYPTWRECCFVNADPSTPFGQYLDAQIDRFLKRYAEIDGVFIDQLCYHSMDFAHSDGYTCVDGRPAYQFGLSYTHNIEKVTSSIHGQGKLAWGNGPFDVEIARYLDGMMSEGTTEISQGFKYLCIRKPLLVHTYPTDELKAEAMLRNCLLAGASWSVGGSSTLRNPPEQTPGIRRLFQEYLPLIEPLLEAEMCLEANPVTLPQGYRGEVFCKRGTGDLHYISLVGESEAEHLEITVHLPHGASALYRGNKDGQWQRLAFAGDVLRLENRSSAYLIVLGDDLK